MVLQEYFKKHRADLVLLMFTAYNDIVNNTFPTAGANENYKPSFWIEDGELQGPTEGWLEPSGPWLKSLILLDRFYGQSRQEQWEAILPTPYQPENEYEGEVDYSWQPAWDEGNWKRVQDIKAEKLDKSLRLTPRSERMKYSIDLTRLLFSEIQKITEVQNGHFMIFKDERPWEYESEAKEKAFFLNNKYYRISTNQYRDNLEDLFRGFEHHRVPLNIGKPTVSENNSHLNQTALHELLEEIAIIISKKNYCCIPGN